jgi:hypothetical protein
MPRKQKSYKEETTEQTRGRKRYLERIQETKDAEEEIDSFILPSQQIEMFPENDGE